MVRHNYFREIKKHCTLKKNGFLRLNIVPYKEKKVFFGTLYFGPVFLMSFYFAKIFSVDRVGPNKHLIVFCSKPTTETIEKGVKNVQS